MSDLSPLNLIGLLTQGTAQGPGVDEDATLVTTGTVLDRDVAGRRVRVSVRGGDVWLPAVAGRYLPSTPVRVLIDPTSARPVLVLGSVQPGAPAILGTVAAVSGTQVTVSISGQSYTIPAVAGSYTTGQTAWVLLDDWGVPVIALGASATVEPPRQTAPPPAAASTVTATVSIGPQASGTYRVSAGRWDQWNTDRYGRAPDIYQGSGYGSGQLIGFAGYGDQIVNLGAVSIDEMVLTARKTADGNSAVLTVQASGSGARPGGAPGGSGDTPSSGSIGSGQTGALALTASMREAFRAGAARGLVAVGGQYGGFGGTSTPGSFVLSIRYTKTA